MEVRISLRGDGATVGADAVFLFDEASLSLPNPWGQSSAGTGLGQCSRWADNGIRALTAQTNLTPYPTSDTLICKIPFSIRANARPGKTTIKASWRQCHDAQLQPTTCGTTTATVEVLGTPSATEAPVASESTSLVVLLAAGATGPSVDEVANHDYRGHPNSAPLPSLRAAPPAAARALRERAQRPRGDYRRYLEADPDHPAARLARSLVLDYPTVAARDAALQRLQRDAAIEAAYVNEYVQLASGGSAGPHAKGGTDPSGRQTHLGILKLPEAWQLAGGWSLIGVVDTGLYPLHPRLRSFDGADSRSGTFVPGGNYLPYFSKNLGGHGQASDNLWENQPTPATAGQEGCDAADGVVDGLMHYRYFGHGTHVAGLLAGNHLPEGGDRGVCRNCGLAMKKASWFICLGPPDFPTSMVELRIGAADAAVALADAIETGTQIINLSLAASSTTYSDLDPSVNAFCSQVELASTRDIGIIAAAGNALSPQLGYPALDHRAVAVGGIDFFGAFWDQSNGNLQNCPTPGSRNESGSNYQVLYAADPSQSPQTARQELVAPARGVRSTVFPTYDHNPKILCGDNFGEGTGYDGSGLCTGTSMSTPQVAGLFGLLRSINPMLPVGSEPWVNGTYGLRKLVADTASRPGAQWHQKLGYGIPDAGRAAKTLLGRSAGQQINNRLTPLLRLYSPGNQDYAAVANPQLAYALTMSQAYTYYFDSVPGRSFHRGNLIPGYTSLRSFQLQETARAGALVLTTEHSPDSSYPTLQPLYLLDRCQEFDSPDCDGAHDFVLATNIGVLQHAVTSLNYRYGGLQGYVYARCSPESECMPPGTEKLHLKCRSAANDCAVFLESERSLFEGSGYILRFGNSPDSLLGYAYPVRDSDGDLLPDGMEYLLGSSPQQADSDGDGLNDGIEYPFAGVPKSDPCDRLPLLHCTRKGSKIFHDGFE